MLLAGLEPDHIARTDFVDRAALALGQTAAGRDDENLAERMRVPCGTSAGLERDRVADRSRWSVAWNKGSIRTVPVNQSAGPLPEGCDPLRLISIVSSRYSSCRVGRNRISLMSTSSGWLMAKATARANESAGIAYAS